MLCPYDGKDYERRYNDHQLDDKGQSSLQKFFKMFEPFKIWDYHTFGYPVYILQDRFKTARSK